MIDPKLINPDDLLRQAQDIQDYVDERTALQQQQEEVAAQQELEETDPKAAREAAIEENLGSREEVKALRSGLAITAESLLTLPERVIDMSTGEMTRQIDEEGEYTPDTNPFGLVKYMQDVQENNLTTTWWGGLIEMGAHYGSLGFLGKAAGVGKGFKSPLAQDLAIGAASDLASKE